MLPTWTFTALEPLVGQTFLLHLAPDQVQSLRLSEAQALGEPRGEGVSVPFSLLFHGPAQPWAAQGTYHMEQAELGALDVFLVPLGPDARGMRYQAIFN
ncbi:hypothetical protein E5F05_01290 (plasmid) [Deinococcus metallilatus]|uniref:DUF6916 domain-containing protein n=1 Tax=Deinococcus metallilatus TaxID=1211322 RepID=A0ABR6MPA1_9DEIO|nr:hypothetical protein [Deinococcus metallilatus]MBB5293544.1 hypothetical protein [Deinococcus metallilatus]QBY06618.1 hypothetical protein E5F05_01290 [Deinococcus metallilatus]RXJ17961.1 hypothetical protein ERJ73_00900 [Deinococcus metallilatus]GMA15235.1 hypothetical protein GCM10025871_15660 [Deinococcus metallilatus]